MWSSRLSGDLAMIENYVNLLSVDPGITTVRHMNIFYCMTYFHLIHCKKCHYIKKMTSIGSPVIYLNVSIPLFLGFNKTIKWVILIAISHDFSCLGTSWRFLSWDQPLLSRLLKQIYNWNIIFQEMFWAYISKILCIKLYIYNMSSDNFWSMIMSQLHESNLILLQFFPAE